MQWRHTRTVSAASFDNFYIGTQRKLDSADESMKQSHDIGNAATARTTEPLLSVPRRPSKWFGVNLFGGTHDVDHGTQLSNLRPAAHLMSSYNLSFAKHHSLAAGLGSEFYFSDKQKHPLSFFHLKTERRNVCFVGSTCHLARDNDEVDKHVYKVSE